MPYTMLLTGITQVAIRLSVALAVWFLGVWIAKHFFSYTIKGTGIYVLVMAIMTISFVFGKLYMHGR